MNTSKLYNALTLLQSEFEETKLVSLLEQLRGHLKNQVGNPAEASFQKGVSDTLTEMRANLGEAPSNDYGNNWSDLMRELHWQDCYGMNLCKKIDEVFGRNAITPSIAQSEINALCERVKKIRQHTNSMIESFEFLELEEDWLAEGECEMSITIPREYFENKLANLGDEIRQMSKFILPPFVESVNESAAGFEMRGVSSSDPTLFIAASPIAAAALFKAIQLALDIYKKYLEIKLTLVQLKQQELPAGEVEKAVKGRLDKLVQKSVSDYLKQIKEIKQIASVSNSENMGRAAPELKSNLERSVKQLVARIDSGFRLDVYGEPYTPETVADPETGEEKTRALNASQKSANALISKVSENKGALDYKPEHPPQFPELLEDLSSKNGDE